MMRDPLIGKNTAQFSSSADPENPSGSGNELECQFFLERSEELHKACSEGNWNDVEKIISNAPAKKFVMTEILPGTGDTALMAAATGRQGLEFIKKLVEKMEGGGLDKQQSGTQNTALHLVATHANVDVAKLLVNKHRRLLTLHNKKGLIPVHLAAKDGRKDMTEYLISALLQDKNSDILEEYLSKDNKDRKSVINTLLFHLAKGRFYGFILDVIEREANGNGETEKKYIKELSVLMKDGKQNFFMVMAGDIRVFRSGMDLNIWENLIYSYVPTRAELPKIPPEVDRAGEEANEHHRDNERSVCWIWKVAQVIVPSVKRIHDEKLLHHQAVELVRQICLRVGDSEAIKRALFEKPFLQGIKNGVHEFVDAILKNHIDAINFIDEKQRSVFHLAVMYRHEEVFKILFRKSNVLDDSYWHDICGNSILHSVAYTASQDRLDLETKGVLQTQRELQWFTEVETFVTEKKVSDISFEELEKHVPGEELKFGGKTPLEIFIAEHDEMAKREKRRMKEMATAGMVASALIASAAFGTTISGPGGNDSDGFPIFSKEPSFIVFSIANILAFVLALASIISFISIYTSRYGYRDFLITLPIRMISGLIALLLSVCTLMIAFSAAVFLVIAKQNLVFLALIIALAIVPVIFCAAFQLPPLLNMIKSTSRPVKLS